MKITVIIPSKGNYNYNHLKKLKKDYPDIVPIVIEKKYIAEAYNIGIKKAKTDIVVTFHEDCYPKSKNFFKTLIEPLKNKNCVASMSEIYDFYSKKKYYPLLDGKATAYKKDILVKINYFDEHTFKTGGEDFDMYMKIKKIGFIAYPNCTIVHKHKNHKNKIKTSQIARANGVLFRRYNFKLQNWLECVLKANPVNYNYFYNFWKAFLKNKQG